MIAVTDTSPLNYLIRLGVPGILSEIYGGVLVPAAVLAELKHAGAPADVRNWASRPPDWLQEVHVRDIDSTLSSALGLGEREAISLAAEIRADILILDDFKARIRKGQRSSGNWHCSRFARGIAAGSAPLFRSDRTDLSAGVPDHAKNGQRCVGGLRSPLE